MFKDKLAIGFFAVSGGLVLLSFLAAILGFKGGGGNLVLSFTSEGEIKMVGNFATFLTLLIVAAVIVIINLVIAHEVYSREKFFAYILGAGSIFFSSLVLIFTWIVLQVN